MAPKILPLLPSAPKPAAPVITPPKPVVAAIAAPKPVVAAIVAPKPVAPVAAVKPAVPAAPVKGKFTLHLSTFGTAESANAFAQRYPGAFVVAGDVSGKGMAYRVRYGNFASFKDASAAKETFESEHNAIALVAAR